MQWQWAERKVKKEAERSINGALLSGRMPWTLAGRGVGLCRRVKSKVRLGIGWRSAVAKQHDKRRWKYNRSRSADCRDNMTVC